MGRLATLSPDARDAIAALKRTKGSAWSTIAPTVSPMDLLFQDAQTRAISQIKKQNPITPAEKFQAFKLMGFDPTPKQVEIVNDTHSIRSVRAGRRSGKTTLAAYEAAAVMLMKPGSHGWIVAPDYQLTYRCWEIMVEALDGLAARGLIKYKIKHNSQDDMRIVLDNGAWAEGQSCEQAEDLQGVGLDWLIIDEVGIVLPFVFTEFLAPALSDRNGWAFMIGTPIGESWTEKEYRHQKRQEAVTGTPSDWSEHLFETWHNLKMFPGGENDPKIKKLQRTMSVEEYMEQVCATPQKSRYVTYKEFDEDVHVRACPFDPEYPVTLSIDPSTGVNPYAVAVIQDRGDLVVQIDEYYRMSVIAQDVIEDLSTRVWWTNVDEAIIDDAWPQEREQWRRHPKIVEGQINIKKAGKSLEIIDSIPLVRKWLRDPGLYNDALIPVRDRIIGEKYPGKEWSRLEVDDQKNVMLLSEIELMKDKDTLFECAKYFVDRRCLNTIDEFSAYQYKKRRRDDQNPSEVPTLNKDHIMDTIRYFLWARKRRYGVQRILPYSYVQAAS